MAGRGRADLIIITVAECCVCENFLRCGSSREEVNKISFILSRRDVAFKLIFVLSFFSHLCISVVQRAQFIHENKMWSGKKLPTNEIEL
jgi:hypothetical protein